LSVQAFPCILDPVHFGLGPQTPSFFQLHGKG
jgi:hypothetical protein